MVTLADLHAIAGVKSRTSVTKDILAAFNKYANEYGVNNQKRIAQFLANVSVETGGFRRLEENMNYSASRLRKVWPNRFKTKAIAEKYARKPQALANYVYGGRMGNQGRDNAGWLHRGSGPGQVTGYDNFLRAEKATGIPFTTQPDLMRDADKGMRAALLMWQLWGCNERADNDRVTENRSKWNGGKHGLTETKAAYRRGMKRKLSVPTNWEEADDEEAQETEELIANPAGFNGPKGKPKATENAIRELLRAKLDLLPLDRRSDAVYVVGVDDYYSRIAERGVYDSAIFLVTPDDVFNFNGNCDPSKYRKGIAQLKTDQAVLYEPGPHGFSRPGGPYKALRQMGKCTVIRDGQGEDRGIFWINIHRGGNRSTSSAGCQTIPPHQWDDFLKTTYDALDRHDQDDVYYVFVDNAAFLAADAAATRKKAEAELTPEAVPQQPKEKTVGGFWADLLSAIVAALMGDKK